MRRLGVALAVVALATATPGMTQSGAHVEADASAIFSNNPFLLPGEDNAAAAFQLAARPEFDWTLGPSSTAELSGEIAYRRYLRRYGDFVTGRARAEARHRDSEYLSFDTQLHYDRVLPADALTDTVDFAIDPRSVRQNYGATSHVDVHPDARTTVSATVGWEKLSYPDSVLLLPTDALNLALSGSRRISPTTTVGLLGGYTRSRMEGTGAATAKSIRGTVAFQPGQALTANAQLGVEWADLGAWPGIGAPPADGRARVSGAATLCYQPQRLEVCLNASLQSEVSGIGGLQREYFAGATTRYRIGEHGNLTANAEYRSADLGGIGVSTRAIRASLGYERRLTRTLWWTGTASYIDRSFLTGGRADAYVLQTGISFRKERP